MTISGKICLIVGILVINNLGLLYILGYFSGSDVPVYNQINTKAVSENIFDSVASPEGSRTAKLNPAADQSSTDYVKEVIEQYIDSQSFKDLIAVSQYQMFVGLQSGYSDLQNTPSSELLETYFNTDSGLEKLMILNNLSNTHSSTLDTDELRQLFLDIETNDEVDARTKSGILTQMLEQGDEEALEWSKNWLESDDNQLDGVDFDFFRELNAKDPEFFASWMSRVSLDRLASPYAGLSYMIGQDQSLAQSFLETHLDTALNSTNQKWHQTVATVAGYQVELDLTYDQQQKVAGLFDSNKRATRAFAISMSRQVDDLQLLRSSYESLARPDEKRDFVHTLARREGEYKELAKEFAEKSTDLSVRAILGRNR